MFKVDFLSEGQILSGINYLQGTETIGEKQVPLQGDTGSADIFYLPCYHL